MTLYGILETLENLNLILSKAPEDTTLISIEQVAMNIERPCVLLSAYACEPGKGSEPGVGWNWAVHLSKYCEVTVITRSNNRSAIEKQFSSNPVAKEIRWVYHDLSSQFLWLKKTLKVHRLYYVLWQQSLTPLIENLCKENRFDIVHHLTFASYRYSTAIKNVRSKKVWGPVGGAESIPWNLLPFNHLPSLFHEIIRNVQSRHVKNVKDSNRFDLVLTSTFETQNLFSKKGISTTLFPTVGIDEAELVRDRKWTKETGSLRLLFVGNLQYLKGIHFVIEALSGIGVPVTFSIVGSGNYEKALRRLTHKLRLSDIVSFLGLIPKKEIPVLHREHDVFIFPSLHDSGGSALLEAMASGMPSITLACGGPKVLTNFHCGIQVSLGDHQSIVQDLATAIRFYANDPSMCEIHGSAGMARVREAFIWENKAKEMIRFYREICEKH